MIAADDEVALLTARFNVRRAELDARANELVGSLVAQQNVILLEEARAQLAALEKEVQSHRDTSQASTAMIREKRVKALATVATAKRNIESLRVVAPFDGFVSVRAEHQRVRRHRVLRGVDARFQVRRCRESRARCSRS